MKCKIVSNSSNICLWGSIERYIRFIIPQMDVEDMVLMDISMFNTRENNRELVMSYVQNKDNVVIIFGLEHQIENSKNDPFFEKVISFSNVGIVNPLKLKDVVEIYESLKNGSKKEESSIIQLCELEEMEGKMSGIRHGMNFDGDVEFSRNKEGIQQARSIGMKGTDEEILQELKNWRPETSGMFKDKFLEGIFVDAFQTLFNEDWTINTKIKEYVEKISKERGKSVIVISDTEKYFVLDKLKKENIEWKLFSKLNLRGATLETVIDNLPKHEFEDVYGITAKDFMHVSNILSEL